MFINDSSLFYFSRVMFINDSSSLFSYNLLLNLNNFKGYVY